MDAVNERLVFSGSAISEVFRFWFDNASADSGYALMLAPGASHHETKFHGWDRQLHRETPVLRLIYSLPGSSP